MSNSKSKTPLSSKSSRKLARTSAIKAPSKIPAKVPAKIPAKAKTKRAVQSTRTPNSDAGFELTQGLAVGYQPNIELTPSDKALFEAFQANLLSLISHELRTPLTGVLNALGVLESGTPEGMSERDLISMAHKNAQRLHRTLITLLDLASIESGAFHARLREVDLLRVLRARWEVQAGLAEFKENGFQVELVSRTPDTLALADPQKIGRAFDVCFAIVTGWGEPKGAVQAQVDHRKVQFTFTLAEGTEAEWDKEWSQGLAAFHGGVGSPSSVFGGVVQSEKGFLSRMREGLGSEFVLLHQILRLHIGQFNQERRERQVSLILQFPDISSDEGLRAILVSRAYVVSHEIGSVALALVEVPAAEDLHEFRAKIAAKLFRATDAVYVLPKRRQIALVLDDCRQNDAQAVVGRFERSLGIKLRFGVAHCPGDGLDPSTLVETATGRLLSGNNEGGNGAAGELTR